MVNNSNKIKSIPLIISGKEGVNYSAYPVTFGVPFADGELERGTTVRVVDETGKAFPTQYRCAATWNKDLRFVRWLLLDVQVDYSTGNNPKLFLECGVVERAPEPEQPVRIENVYDALLIDTGTMRLKIRNSFDAWKQPYKPDIFAGCKVKRALDADSSDPDDWVDVFRGNPGPYLYMKDQFGNDYNSWNAGPPPRVIVEEEGPLRSCICIKGFHAMHQGQRFCPYILRIHVFAGKSDMRIFHTFIFDQEPHNIELASVGIYLPLALGNNIKACIGGTDRSHRAGNWQEMSFLQNDDRNYSVIKDGKIYGKGEKTRGWTSLNGTLGSAVAVIRNCWQEYPKGFILNSGGIDIQIWPDSYGQTLKFTTPFEEPAVRFDKGPEKARPLRDEEEVKRIIEANPTGPLNLKSFGIRSKEDLIWVEEMVGKYAPNRIVTYNDTGTSNGAGAAKTTEIYMSFKGSTIDDRTAEEIALTVQTPLVVIAEPEYSCETKALGHFYHGGDSRFKAADSALDDLIRITAIEPIERCRLYGMMRYGNMVCHHSPAPDFAYIHHIKKNPEKALRWVGPYNNEANDQISSVWGNFIRTGRRDHLFLAQNYSRCVADVSFIHAHPSNPDSVGLMHYHNGHQWSGGGSPSHSIITGLLWDYYFTGNRRLLEVALETADRTVRTQTAAGTVSCNGILHREFTGPMWAVLEAYQATWKEKYGDVAARSLNWFLRTLPEPGRYPNSVFTRGERGDEAVVQGPIEPRVSYREVYYMYSAALRLFDSKRLREHVIAEADYYVWDAPLDVLTYYAGLACLAYDLTGDFIYPAYCKAVIEGPLQKAAVLHRKREAIHFGDLFYGSTIPKLMRIVADAMDRDSDAFLKASDQWRRERAKRKPLESKPRPDRDPGTSLGILSTEHH